MVKPKEEEEVAGEGEGEVEVEEGDSLWLNHSIYLSPVKDLAMSHPQDLSISLPNWRMSAMLRKYKGNVILCNVMIIFNSSHSDSS